VKPMIDYYEVLGVSPSSDEVVIKAAYKALMQKFHPDRNPSPEASNRATEINGAYAVVGDPLQRAEYDQQRAAWSAEAAKQHVGPDTAYDNAEELHRGAPATQFARTYQRRRWAIATFGILSLAFTLLIFKPSHYSVQPLPSANILQEEIVPAAVPETVYSDIVDSQREGAIVAPDDEPQSAPLFATDDTNVGVIGAFYEALARGQGAAASNMVVPEKRTLDAFTAESLSRFYGSLAEPIQLLGVEASDDGTHKVHYRYSTKSRTCNGYASITTVTRHGIYYIQKILPLNGC
jgi:hypothetical protein